MMQAEEYRTIFRRKKFDTPIGTNSRECFAQQWIQMNVLTSLDLLGRDSIGTTSSVSMNHQTFPIEHWSRMTIHNWHLFLHNVYEAATDFPSFTFKYDITRQVTTQKYCYPTGRTRYMEIFARDFWSTILRPPDDFLGQQGCSEWLNGNKDQVLRWSMP